MSEINRKRSIFEKLFLSKKDKEKVKNDENYKQDIEGFNIDDYEEVDDNDQDFIMIDGKKMRKKNKKALEQPKVKKIIDDLIMANPDSYLANQQRNLDRETGGTELPKTFITSDEDVWDDRGKEIEEMSEIKPQDLDDKASMIWDKKRKKKQQEAHQGNHDPKENKPKSFLSKSKNKGGSREL
jgi:hypothetical protein